MTKKPQAPQAPPSPHGPHASHAPRFKEGDRVRLNAAYCTKWKIPEWKDWGTRKGTVIYSDTTRIDVLFDRVHPVRGRTIQALFTNPDLLEKVPRREDKQAT